MSENNKDQPKNNKEVYTLIKYEETLRDAAEKISGFFRLSNFKQFIDSDKKSQYEKKILNDFLEQIKTFIIKKCNVRIKLF